MRKSRNSGWGEEVDLWFMGNANVVVSRAGCWKIRLRYGGGGGRLSYLVVR